MNPINLFTHLSDTISRFLPAFQSRQEFEALMFRYGWLVGLDDNTFGAINNIKELSDALIAFNSKLSDWIGGEQKNITVEGANTKEKDWQVYVKELYPLVKTFYNTILKLKDLNDIEGSLLAPLDEEAFWEDISEQLLEDILVLFLQWHYPMAYGVMHLFGIIEYHEKEMDEPDRINHTRTNIDWGRMADFISGPHVLFADLYNWKKDQEIHWEKLLRAIEFAGLASHLQMRFVLPRKSIVDDAGFDFISPNYMAVHQINELQLPFIYGTSILDGSFYNVSLAMMPIGKAGQLNNQNGPKGLFLSPIIRGSREYDFMLTPEIALEIGTGLDAGNLVGVAIYPDGVQLQGSTSNADLHFRLSGKPYNPWLLFGTPDSHRLELHGFDARLMVERKDGEVEVKIAFSINAPEPDKKGLQAIILLDEADSFVKDATQQEKIEAGLDLEIIWSNKTGFRFGASAALDFRFRLNKSLGPIKLTNMYLELGTGEKPIGRKHQPISFRTGLGIKGDIGPVKFQIENMGMSLDVIPYTTEEVADLKEPPLLGMMDLDLGFAPPKGLGFVLDTKAVKGGGFLSFDKGEYLGYLELRIVDKFTVKAIGIVTTELPDGQHSYSFLLLILTEFKPIQLGMGFTLNGVGGIIGLHRDLHVDNIIAGMDEDTYKHLLFPEKPEENINDIISSLNVIMPIRRGQYAFGIMAEIGWGTNNFLEVKAGLLFSLPDFAIAIIGIAKAEIKRNDKTLVRLLFKFNATYDEALFTFDGSLEGSKLLRWDIVGDFAVRIRGGDDPYFLVSAGGFHPGYRPPEGLKMRKKMDRLRITFFDDNPHVFAECYFAITSNTLQFGGRGYGTYRKWGFGFDAELGFNALIQFNPLYFEASVYGRVELYAFGRRFFGVSLRGTVTGPYPLQFDLYVTVSLWIFDVTVSVTLGPIGKSADTSLEGVAILPILIEQLKNERNWVPSIPSGVPINVNLRKYEKEVPVGEIAPDSNTKFHPVGSLTIRQNQVPLNLELDKFAHRPPADYQKFELNVQGKQSQSVQEFFAPGQFLDIPKEEQYKRKHYEKLDAGVEISGKDNYVSGKLLEKKVEYEQHYIDDEYISEAVKEPMDGAIFDRLLKKNSVAKSERGQAFSLANAESKLRFKLGETLYAVKRGDTLTAFGPQYENIHCESEAYRLKRKLMEQYPENINDFEVVPMYELQSSAI